MEDREALRKKKWSVHFFAEHLAFLLVLRKQVEKEKEVQEASNRTIRSSLPSKGVPKANDLNRAFCKLWEGYPPPPIFSPTLEIVRIAMGLAVLLLTLARSLL